MYLSVSTAFDFITGSVQRVFEMLGMEKRIWSAEFTKQLLPN